MSIPATVTSVETRDSQGFATSGTVRFRDGLQDTFRVHSSGVGYVDGIGDEYDLDRAIALNDAIENERETREPTEDERRESWVGRWVRIRKLFGGEFSGVITGRLDGMWYAYGSGETSRQLQGYVSFTSDMILDVSE